MTVDQVEIAQWAGIGLGAILLLTVAWVWIQEQVYGLNGMGISLVGVVLVGLTLWQSVSFSYTKDGLDVQLTRLQEQVDQTQENLRIATDKIVEVQAANAAVSTHLLELSQVSRAQNLRVNEIAGRLRQAGGDGVSEAPVIDFDTRQLEEIASGQFRQ